MDDNNKNHSEEVEMEIESENNNQNAGNVAQRKRKLKESKEAGKKQLSHRGSSSSSSSSSSSCSTSKQNNNSNNSRFGFGLKAPSVKIAQVTTKASATAKSASKNQPGARMTHDSGCSSSSKGNPGDSENDDYYIGARNDGRNLEREQEVDREKLLGNETKKGTENNSEVDEESKGDSEDTTDKDTEKEASNGSVVLSDDDDDGRQPQQEEEEEEEEDSSADESTGDTTQVQDDQSDDEKVDDVVPTEVTKSFESIANELFGSDEARTDAGKDAEEDSTTDDNLQHLSERKRKREELLRPSKPDRPLRGYSKSFANVECSRIANGCREYYEMIDRAIEVGKEIEQSHKACHRRIMIEVRKFRRGTNTKQALMEAQKGKIAKVKKAVMGYKAAVVEYETKLESLNQEHANLLNRVEANEKDEKEAQEALENVQSQIEEAKSLLKTKKEEVEHETSLQEGARLEHESKLEEARKQSETRKEALEQELEQVQSQTTKVEQEISELKTKLDALNQELATTNKEVQSVSNEISSLTSKKESLEKERDVLQRRTETAEEKLNARESSLEKAMESAQRAQQFCETLGSEKYKLEERINGLREEKSALSLELTNLQNSVSSTEKERDALKSRLEEKQARVKELEDQLLEAEEAKKAAATACEEQQRQTKELAAAQKKESDEYEAQIELDRTKVKELTSKAAELTEKQTELTRKNESLKADVSSTRSAVESAGQNKDETLEKMSGMKQEVEDLQARMDAAMKKKSSVMGMREKLQAVQEKLFKAEEERRKLHNEVQELKGNVRVVARVRPAMEVHENPKDKTTSLSRLVCSSDDVGIELTLSPTSGNLSTKNEKLKHEFSFNRVFAPEASQQHVFKEVSLFVQSALDGYSVCLFSYGQTGSGKTYTMTGDHNSSIHRGIIPRAVDHVSKHAAELRDKGWEFTMKSSFLEIYNETIRDLLVSKRSSKASNDLNKLDIRLGENGNVHVPGLTTVPVKKPEQIHELLALADTNRSVAATDSNQHSSRSHSIFTLYLTGTHQESGTQIEGSLSMCDLAGSERLARSNAKHQRLEETKAINKSLSSLASVFAALQTKAAHIPFRNSKLTHLLSPCFSGDGKVLMIVNVSADHSDAGETLASLRFAQKVNQTELGQATRHVVSSVSNE